MTRADYIALFPSEQAAREYEERVLSIGSEFLPECAREVRDQGVWPTEAYWDWLISQVEL